MQTESLTQPLSSEVQPPVVQEPVWITQLELLTNELIYNWLLRANSGVNSDTIWVM